MRSAVLASAICGLVSAAPQAINIEAIADLPTPTALGPEPAATTTPAVTYNPSVAASSVAAAISTDPPTLRKRNNGKRNTDECTPTPDGVGPLPGAGSVADYLAEDSILAQNANRATVIPSGYQKSFTNLQGSTQQIGYLTYKTLNTQTYDVQACADFCDSEKFCLGFNIFYERDPSVDPQTACPNPPAVTNLKCAIYGYPVAKLSATNTGQYRGPEDASGESFHVVIAGSNGYSKISKTPASTDRFTGPVVLPAAINAPSGTNTYNGMKLYNEGPFDPSICAAACEAQTAFDKEHLVDEEGKYRPCNFFNAYILTKNDVPQGTYCSFYTQEWDSTNAVNTGYFSGDDTYKVLGSVAYTLTELDSGSVQQPPRYVTKSVAE